MFINFLSNKNKVAAIIIAVVGVQLFFLWGVRPFADEIVHFAQISRISNGSYTLNPYITTLPFFHYFFAAIIEFLRILEIDDLLIFLKLVKSQSEFGLNTVRILIGLISAYLLIFAVRKSEDFNNNQPDGINNMKGNFRDISAGILILSVPIIFPMLSLVYTDVLALALVLVSIVSSIYKKRFLSALAIFTAVLVRQPSIIWIAIPILFIAEDELKYIAREFLLVVKGQVIQYRNVLTAVKSILVSLSYHIAVVAIFIAYMVYNNGIAFGDKNHHVVALNLSNVWFFGFVFFVCCIGYRYEEIKRSLGRLFAHLNELLFSRKLSTLPLESFMKAALIASLLVLGAAIFWDSYEITHQYNTSRYLGFLRNKILALTTTSILAKGLFGIVSFTGLYAFLAYPTIKKSKVADIVFKACSVVPIAFMPLIEQRYYIPAIGLFLLFTSLGYRQQFNSKLSTSGIQEALETQETTVQQEQGSAYPLVIQTIFNICLSVYLFYSILSRSFFL